MAQAALDAPQSFEFVEAPMNYIIDDGQAPVLYVDWPEEAHKAVPPRYEPHMSRIYNGRLVEGGFDLDTYGFTFAHWPSDVTEFYDTDHVYDVYSKEVEKIIGHFTGAKRVVCFDHTIRTADQEIVEGKGVREPVKSVHNDYTEKSAPQRFRDILGEEEAEEALENRYGIVQTWRPINTPVERDPFAICDGRTIPKKGFIKMERRYSYRTAETYHIAYTEGHKWYYYPNMTPEEVMVFKVFDSDPGDSVPFTAHSAFDDPMAAPGARFRESIESRALVLF